MRDPVTEFAYPDAWVEACRQTDLLPLVEQGLCVLTASGRVLRRGYTTGTTAAAACKAAVLSLQQGEVTEVTVSIPCGLAVSIGVDAYRGRSSCRKDSGDYAGDVTAGLEFAAYAVPASSVAHFVPGEGIGTFCRETARHAAGDPAISEPAMACIDRSIREAVEAIGIAGVTVVLSIPRGAETAQLTLNPRMGIVNGISVLGSTGLVEPWDDHLTETVLDRVARADRVVMTTGRIGLRYSRLYFPEHEAVLVGSRIGEALARAHGDVVLCGLPGLIMKCINPNVLIGTGYATVEDLAASPAWGEIVQRELAAFAERCPDVRVVLVARDGRIIGESG